ncbi:MAG TPA: hypothetical protein VM077_04530 [Candidatus Limnocylindrales bacterium]|nr:hypothetical protein [Candidatus Limnocylindrales bacterium]
MNSFFSNFKKNLIKFRWIIIPVIPLIFLITTLTYIFSPTGTEKQNLPTPSTSPKNSPPFVIPNKTLSEDRPESIEESLDEMPSIQSKEILPDKTIKYTFVSKVPTRPNIIYAKNTHDVQFQRSVISPGYPVKITDYTDSYGPAKWIFKGSIFYGPEAQTYIYPELGIAFIAKPSRDEVLEYHLFSPMKVEEYVKKYGEDIPAQP